YRITTAPEPNSSRLTSFKSIRFDSPANNVGPWPTSLGCTTNSYSSLTPLRFDRPANNVGPWPTSLGCTTNSYSSINPSSANAIGSFTPPTNSPLPDSCLSCWTAFPRSPRTSSAFQSTRLKVLDTTYFFAASTSRAKGSING